MQPLRTILAKNGLTPVAGTPEGVDALALAQLFDGQGGASTVLHIARDEARLTRLVEALRFFAPAVEIVALPAWDCLPYDRVPPHVDVAARRLAALIKLATPAAAAGRCVVTTVSSALQRIPPLDLLSDSVFHGAVGTPLSLDALTAFFAANGYVRAGTVREPGEYAVRGGIVDVYPAGSDEPVRLDLFGDELEGIRGFDAMSQLTTGTHRTLSLAPISEVLLSADSIQRFRNRYRTQFGVARDSDLLYEAISAGQRHPGMEHWLPLYYEALPTLFDVLADAPLTLDHQIDEAVEERFELIAEYHHARQELTAAGKRRAVVEAPVYNPLPTDALYLSRDEWQAALVGRPCVAFSSFTAPTDSDGMATLGGRRIADFAEARKRQDIRLFDAVRERLANEQAAGRRTVVAAYSVGARERLIGLMRDHGIATAEAATTWDAARGAALGTAPVVVLSLEAGFTIDDLTLVTEQDILGERLARPAAQRRRAENFIAEISSLNLSDLVVHVDHGIGRYDGLETLEIAGAPHDCLRLVYAGGDKLFLPVENLELLSRFGPEEAEVGLDKLGGAGWQSRKARVKSRIKDMAHKLLAVAAERTLKRADKLVPPAGVYEEFAARFPFAETDDQDRAIAATLDDLISGRPMDRLICGDAGFGKTEVALRAAFVAVMAGHQVAIVVPTTLLARQHAATFAERFAGLPVRIEQLSRLVAGKQATAVRDGIADGTVDIVVGTHTLLANSIRFQDLALLIVDEEQHFGVAQKERLKQLRADVHVLTLTATPIPRTLQLALSGVREMSLIATPPVDRLAVRTFVLPYDPVIVREAITRERFRGGQVFYVCPRVRDLPAMEDRLRQLVPDIRLAIAHGKLAARDLDRVMTAFYAGGYDILLCTNIIESGLDIPSANTIIVHRSDMFGLAQLYQLRGRVGRSKTRAYAYLTLPVDRPLTATAQRRLDVMQTLDSLGAGFSLASHDLDIRGAGNLLGEEQSGHIKEVGAELYQQLLEEAVAAARQAGGREAVAAEDEWTPTITVGTPVLIPEDYVADLTVRLGLYRRLVRLVDAQEIEGFAAEMIDRFGPLPASVENLLTIIGLKQLCREAAVEKLDAGPKGALVTFHNNHFPDPAALVEFITRQAGQVTLRPDHKLVYRADWPDPRQRLQQMRTLMRTLAALAAGDRAAAAQ